jgi:hypothetical protein
VTDQTTDASAQTGNATGSQSGSAAGDGQQNTGAGTGGATGGDATQAEKHFTQADIDRIVTERLNQEKQRAKRATEEAAAKAKGEFEQLYQQEKARADKVEADLAAARLEGTRARAAAKHGLPAELAGRLSGSTEAEIEADAKALAGVVAARAAGSANAGDGNSTPAPAATMNDLIRRAAGRA